MYDLLYIYIYINNIALQVYIICNYLIFFITYNIIIVHFVLFTFNAFFLPINEINPTKCYVVGSINELRCSPLL